MQRFLFIGIKFSLASNSLFILTPEQTSPSLKNQISKSPPESQLAILQFYNPFLVFSFSFRVVAFRFKLSKVVVLGQNFRRYYIDNAHSMATAMR